MSGRACVGCGKKGAALLFVSPDINYRTDGREFEVFKCPHCGLVSLPAPPEDLAKYYGDHYAPPKAGAGAALALAKSVGRFAKVNRNPLPLIACSPGKRKILEVGCGNGILLALIARMNPDADATGIEMRGNAARQAKARGLDVREGDFFEVAKKLRSGQYDLIVLNHSFEHLPRPKKALTEFRRLLRKGGEVALVVPNAEGASCTTFGKWAEPFDVPRHLFGFTGKSISGMAWKAGFTASVKTFSEGSYIPASAMNRLGIERKKYYTWRERKAFNFAWIAGELCLSWAMLVPDALGLGDQLFVRLKKE
ncbi:Ubiquinone biosynthesis O-methyltransferase [uncultured archaeon]|nr:Ubiquinone biosynthesis O-methyltransferase [uncultured archaeon]